MSERYPGGGRASGREERMLQIKNLNITHKKDLRVILQDFSCVLNEGDKAVVIGEEGNGKSTLLKWLYDPALVEDYADAAGERILNGERLAYLPQELPEEDEGKTIYEFFSEEMHFLEKTPKELGRLAKDFDVPNDFFYEDQRMGTLSGGEKVKAQLMRLLMTEPTVLLLDEPSNDIDIGMLEQLEKLIAGWPWIVLFISHDETLIERTANTVIHMERLRRKTVGRCGVAHMSYQEYREERLVKFENQQRRALSEQREKKIRDEKMHRLEQSVSFRLNNISKAARGSDAHLKKKMKAVKSIKYRYERQDENMTQMPEEEDAIFFKLGGENSGIPAGKGVIDFSMERLRAADGGRILAKEIRLSVRGSEKICIVGRNGAGKTTLLKRIAKELLERSDIRAEYMPQNYEDMLNPELTPVDFLDPSGEKDERTKIRTYLGALKYTADEMDHPISRLSGGQKAKVLLLKMSLSGANVLILDEPTRNFSPLSGPVIRRMLAAFPGAVISVSHDRKYIEEVCDKVYRLTQDGLEPEYRESLS